jgi:hypothetical protein
LGFLTYGRRGLRCFHGDGRSGDGHGSGLGRRYDWRGFGLDGRSCLFYDVDGLDGEGCGRRCDVLLELACTLPRRRRGDVTRALALAWRFLHVDRVTVASILGRGIGRRRRSFDVDGG